MYTGCSDQPNTCEVLSEHEVRIVDPSGAAWRLVRVVSAEGIDVSRRREGTVPFYEERRMAGELEGQHIISMCEDEGRHDVTWIDADHDGIHERVRHRWDDGLVRTEDAEGHCLEQTRTTSLPSRVTSVATDADCDGTFERIETFDRVLHAGSSC